MKKGVVRRMLEDAMLAKGRALKSVERGSFSGVQKNVNDAFNFLAKAKVYMGQNPSL